MASVHCSSCVHDLDLCLDYIHDQHEMFLMFNQIHQLMICVPSFLLIPGVLDQILDRLLCESISCLWLHESEFHNCVHCYANFPSEVHSWQQSTCDWWQMLLLYAMWICCQTHRTGQINDWCILQVDSITDACSWCLIGSIPWVKPMTDDPLMNPGRVLCSQALYFPILQHWEMHTHPMSICLHRGSTPQSRPCQATDLSTQLQDDDDEELYWSP